MENWHFLQKRFVDGDIYLCDADSVDRIWSAWPDQSACFNSNWQVALDTGNVEGYFGHFAKKLIMEDGVWAGAKVQGYHAPMIHHMGGGADLSGIGVMGNAGFLNLDMDGKRFMNEDIAGNRSFPYSRRF